MAILFLSFRRAQQIDRQSALQAAEKENTDRIPFTLSFFTLTTTQLNLSFLKTLNYSKTIQRLVLSQPPFISFKRDKNTGNFLVRRSFQTNDQSGAFKCTRSRCKTCSFIHNVEKISDPSDPLRSLITLRVPPPMSFSEGGVGHY